MGNGIFNVAKGQIAYYASLPGSSDAIKVLLLKSSGLQADATLADHDTVAAVLAASNDEADATNYVRKTAGSVTVTVDDTNDRVDIDCADITWTTLGGASNNTLGALMFFYVPDTGAEADSSNIPLSFHTFSYTTTGVDVSVLIPTAGFMRAA